MSPWYKRLSTLTLAVVLASLALTGCDEEPESAPSDGVAPTSTSGTGPGLNEVPGTGEPTQRAPRPAGLQGTLLFQYVGKTAVLDVSTGSQRYIPARGLTDVSADGQELLFSYYDEASDSYQVEIGDRRGVVTTRIGPWRDLLRAARFSPDGETLAGLAGPEPAPLVTFSRTGERLRVFANDVSSFAFLPDGRILFAYEDGLYVLDLQTEEIIGVAEFPGGSPSGLAPSPDGRRVALELGDAGVLRNHVYVIDLLAHDRVSVPRQLTTSVGNEADPAWSPDGTLIVVRQGVGSFPGGGCPLLYVVDANAMETVRVGLNGVAPPIPMHDETGFSRAEACAFSLVHWR